MFSSGAVDLSHGQLAESEGVEVECESSEKQSFSSQEGSRMHLKSDPSALLCNFLNINLLGGRLEEDDRFNGSEAES